MDLLDMVRVGEWPDWSLGLAALGVASARAILASGDRAPAVVRVRSRS